MTKYYLFLASNPLDRDLWEESLSSLIKEPLSFTYESDRKGYILASEKLGIRLQDCLYNIHEDLVITVTVVIAHRDGALEEKLLREALSYFPNQCLYLTDMLMKELSFGDYSSFPLLSNEFRNVPHDLLLTAGTYLRCGMDASETAQSLFIHRNTFNYRLAAFIAQTQLDIRDYHNALLLELYFQLGSGK